MGKYLLTRPNRSTNSVLREQIDQLLDDWFRPHQDYIYNKSITGDFLDSMLQLIQTHDQSKYQELIEAKTKLCDNASDDMAPTFIEAVTVDAINKIYGENL